MRINNTDSQYGIIAIFLHWIMAIFIIGLLVLGLYMVDLPKGINKIKLIGLHKEFGILVLMLVIVRLTWRFTNITPKLDSLWWEKFAAHCMHWILYGLMFAMPITGWLMSSAAGFPVSFFGLFLLPNLIQPDQKLKTLFSMLHEWIAYGFIAAIVGHTGAALKHHFIDKDNILRRMLFP